MDLSFAGFDIKTEAALPLPVDLAVLLVRIAAGCLADRDRPGADDASPVARRAFRAGRRGVQRRHGSGSGGMEGSVNGVFTLLLRRHATATRLHISPRSWRGGPPPRTEG